MNTRITGGFWRVAAILCGAFAIGSVAAPARAAEELRIGFLAPLTGPFAQIGKDMANGFQLYLDEVGGISPARR